jgi:Tfp pilus assembly protein PilN
MNDLSYNDGVLTLNASTSNIIDVARFMVKLRQLEYIQSVKFSSIDSKEVKESSEDSKDTFDFHLSVEFVNNETKDIEIEDQVEEGVD